jgi:glyoxylase-like metal-dependent hydrolase (beta-lactamase superfamily II)
VVAIGEVQREAWALKILPPVERVSAGLWSIPVPIPGNPLRYVLVYAMETDDGLVLVDAGWESHQSWQALVDGLGVFGAKPADVSTILVTHMHPDHFGLAARLKEQSGADVVMHAADAALLAGPAGTVSYMLSRHAHFLRGCGMPEAEVDGHVDQSGGVIPFRESDPPDRLVADDDVLDLGGRRLRVVWTPGHTPGHVCLLDEREGRLFAGDHVLPRISPNVALYTTAPVNPLADFLDSLEKVSKLKVQEVLPAHEYRFTALADRALSLVRHHGDRLTEIHELLCERPGATCWELTTALTWSRPWTQITGHMRQAATGETMAHLAFLARAGRVQATGEQPWRWYPSSASDRRPLRSVAAR